jgi:hypothetical protein
MRMHARGRLAEQTSKTLRVVEPDGERVHGDVPAPFGAAVLVVLQVVLQGHARRRAGVPSDAELVQHRVQALAASGDLVVCLLGSRSHCRQVEVDHDLVRPAGHGGVAADGDRGHG